MFGKSPIVTEVLEAPPTDFKPAPEERVAVLSKDSKSLKNLVKSRDAYFKDHWGFVQFCKVCSKANLPARFQQGTHAFQFHDCSNLLQDKVCGYVRFAPKCRGECEDVFPEYRERNFGVPELDGSVKITNK